MITPIERVISSRSPFGRTSVRKMEHVLNAQGQIEPLQVQIYSTNDGTPTYITFDEDVHACDIIQAARNLNWPTLLITVEKRYIP